MTNIELFKVKEDNDDALMKDPVKYQLYKLGKDTNSFRTFSSNWVL